MNLTLMDKLNRIGRSVLFILLGAILGAQVMMRFTDNKVYTYDISKGRDNEVLVGGCYKYEGELSLSEIDVLFGTFSVPERFFSSKKSCERSRTQLEDLLRGKI